MMPVTAVAGEEHVVGEQVGMDHARPAGRAASPARGRSSSAAMFVLEPGLDLVGACATVVEQQLPAGKRERVGAGRARNPAPARCMAASASPSAAQCAGVDPPRPAAVEAADDGGGLVREPAQRPAVASMHRQRTRQPCAGQMLHQAEEERQVGGVDPLLVDGQDEAAALGVRGGSSSSRPPRRSPRRRPAPPSS